MANTPIKFFKGANQPASVVGSIWFNTSDRTIRVCTGNTADSWEIYTGLVDASYANNKLTITKAVGQPVELDFSDVASLTEFNKLVTRVGNLETWQATATGQLTTLEGKMTTVEGKAAAAETKLAGLSKDTVMAEIEAQVAAEAALARKAEGDLAARVTPLETASADYADRIADLEAAVGEGGDVATQINNAISNYNTNTVTPGLAAKADKATYEDYVAANDAALAAVKKTAEDEVARATAEDALINEKFGAAYSKDNTIAASIAAAQKAADDARAIIDDFLSEEGISDEAVNSLKEIVDYMEKHGTEYQGVVTNLNTLNTDVAALQGKVDVAKVSEAIATAKGEAVSSANGYTDEKIAAEVLRADGKYEEKGVAAGLVSALENGTVAGHTTAISGLQAKVDVEKVSTAIATAKSEAITAAGQAADQKIADLKLAETYEKVGEAKKLVDALANGAVAGNTTEITNLKAALAVGDGFAWAQFA